MVALLSALVLWIGIGQAADARLVQQTYSVADLVIPVAGKSPTTTSEEQLIQLITSTIAPDSWVDMGGVGTIEYFPNTMALIINQTPDVLEQVQDLLAALRRLNDQEVATEVRFVAVSEKVFQDLEQRDLVRVDDGENVSFLDEARVRQLLECIQQDRATNVLQAPKVTAFNGQVVPLEVGEKQSFVTGVDIRWHDGRIITQPKTEVIPIGLRLTLQPTISADRRFVRLFLNLKWNSLVSEQVPLLPITVPVQAETAAGGTAKPAQFTQYIQQPRINKVRLERSLEIPDGQTAVLAGLKRPVEQRSEYGPPVLSNIPYINRLFKNVGYGRSTESLLVLVTPHIIVSRETAEKPGKGPACGKKVNKEWRKATGEGSTKVFPKPASPRETRRIKTVKVSILPGSNKRSLPTAGLEGPLTEALVKEIEHTTRYKVVQDNADTELVGIIRSLSLNNTVYTQLNERREGEATLVVELRWRDLRTGEILSKPRPQAGQSNPLALAVGLPDSQIPISTPDSPLSSGAPGVMPGAVIHAVASFRVELGQSLTSAQQKVVNIMATQIASLMECGW
jgi:hypothetical protein